MTKPSLVGSAVLALSCRTEVGSLYGLSAQTWAFAHILEIRESLYSEKRAGLHTA